jgi:hypothetical protein
MSAVSTYTHSWQERERKRGRCACGGSCAKCRAETLERKSFQAGAWSAVGDRGHNFGAMRVLADQVPSQTPNQDAMDAFCIGVEPGQGSTRCEFTDRQAHTVSAVKFAARSLTGQALQALGRGDPYMSTVASRAFHISDPDMDQVSVTTAGLLDALRSKPVVCGTCSDADCNQGGVVAHVPPDLSSIILCPRFFMLSAVEMRRTLIHEAGHAIGIDSSLGDTREDYCKEGESDCTDPCSNLGNDLRQNVDAWSRFIECAGASS